MDVAHTHLVDQPLDLRPQLVLALDALDGREGLVEARRRRFSHVPHQVREVLRALELDLAVRRGGVHGGRVGWKVGLL